MLQGLVIAIECKVKAVNVNVSSRCENQVYAMTTPMYPYQIKDTGIQRYLIVLGSIPTIIDPMVEHSSFTDN